MLPIQRGQSSKVEACNAAWASRSKQVAGSGKRVAGSGKRGAGSWEREAGSGKKTVSGKLETAAGDGERGENWKREKCTSGPPYKSVLWLSWLPHALLSSPNLGKAKVRPPSPCRPSYSGLANSAAREATRRALLYGGPLVHFSRFQFSPLSPSPAAVSSFPLTVPADFRAREQFAKASCGSPGCLTRW